MSQGAPAAEASWQRRVRRNSWGEGTRNQKREARDGAFPEEGERSPAKCC